MIKVLEYTWLCMALFGLCGIVYKLLQQEEATPVGFFIFTSIAVVMYLYRRRQRISIDRTRAEDTSDKYH